MAGNFLEHIEHILEAVPKGMHVKIITENLLSKGLWSSEGKTPAATIASRLYTHIKKHGDKSRIIQVGPQTFALKEGYKGKPHTSGKPKGKLSFVDSAERILQDFADKHPMHYRAITEKALELDLLDTGGQTPEATMYAQILTEIRRHKGRGQQPRFIQHGKGMVGLSSWMGQGLSFQIEQHNAKVRKELLKRLLKMDWGEFEELVGELLAKMGFDEIQITPRGGDGGIDVRGTLVVSDTIRIRMAVQVKRWKNNVQAPEVQKVRGSLGTHDQGLIITTSDFSAGAKTEAFRADATPVALMNGEQLVNLMLENQVGVQKSDLEVYEITPNFLESLEKENK
jgi:restriction system protein